VTIFKDSHGAIWCGTVNSGVIRIYQGRVDYYAHANGLSGNWIQSITEDLKATSGSLLRWASTNSEI
jgi:hypothetical protein